MKYRFWAVILGLVLLTGVVFSFTNTNIDTSFLKAQPPQPPPGNQDPGPPSSIGNFAPLDASYVVTQPNDALTN